MGYSKWLLWLIKVSIGLTLVVIVLGAYTRISDAGLGCPDWPGCYGQIIVPVHNDDIVRASQLFPYHVIEPYKAWLEMIHRYAAGILGLLIAAILLVSFKLPQLSKRLPLALAFLVLLQAALGMWTVTLKLMPIIVVLHLFGGFTLLSLLLVFYLSITACNTRYSGSKARQINTRQVPRVQSMGWVALLVLLIQIFLGGWTSSNYAALVCTSLPLCEGDWWRALNINGALTLFQHPLLAENGSYEYGVLDYSSRMTIHVLHRMGAVLTAMTLCIFAWRLRTSDLDSRLNIAAWSLAGLVVVQIGLGISNVVLHLPVILAVAHNLVAALLLLNVVFICATLRLRFLVAAAVGSNFISKPTQFDEKINLK